MDKWVEQWATAFHKFLSSILPSLADNFLNRQCDIFLNDIQEIIVWDLASLL